MGSEAEPRQISDKSLKVSGNTPAEALDRLLSDVHIGGFATIG
jgi:hypothetical protein